MPIENRVLSKLVDLKKKLKKTNKFHKTAFRQC